jgi:hypothetical protein
MGGYAPHDCLEDRVFRRRNEQGRAQHGFLPPAVEPCGIKRLSRQHPEVNVVPLGNVQEIEHLLPLKGIPHSSLIKRVFRCGESPYELLDRLGVDIHDKVDVV